MDIRLPRQTVDKPFLKIPSEICENSQNKISSITQKRIRNYIKTFQQFLSVQNFGQGVRKVFISNEPEFDQKFHRCNYNTSQTPRYLWS